MKTCILCHKKVKLAYQNLCDDRYGARGRYIIYRCQNCGFGRTIPSLTKREIGLFYAKYYPLLSVTAESVRKSVKIPPKWLAWLNGNDNTTHWYIKPNSVVLDIGSGSGRSLLEIEKLGGRAYGVEPDPNAQKIAKKLNLRVYQGFIADDPFPEIKFDFITASQVIEHDPNPEAFLRAVYKHLKDDGKVIMSFPNIDALYRKIFGKRWLHWHVPYHINFFNKQSFMSLTKATGFEVIKIRTITPNLWTILQLQMLLTRPEEGKMNPIWAAQHQNPGTKLTSSPMIARLGIRVMNLVVTPIIIIINRLIDSLGFGESFLVILSKNGK